MKYNVDFVFHGHWDIDVEAESEDEAIDIANKAFETLDIGELYDFDGEPYCIDDADGNYKYFD